MDYDKWKTTDPDENEAFLQWCDDDQSDAYWDWWVSYANDEGVAPKMGYCAWLRSPDAFSAFENWDNERRQL